MGKPRKRPPRFRETGEQGTTPGGEPYRVVEVVPLHEELEAWNLSGRADWRESISLT